MQCGKISWKKDGVAKSSVSFTNLWSWSKPIFSARDAICCHAFCLFFQDAKSSALSVLRSPHFRRATFSNKMHSGATIVRFEPAEDEWWAEWRHRDVGDSSFIPSSRRMRLPVLNANNTDDDTRYFPDKISEESCWDLVAMDCIRYEESMDCKKRISHISHNNIIWCDFPLTWLRAVKRPWPDKDVKRRMHVGRDFFAGSEILSLFVFGNAAWYLGPTWTWEDMSLFECKRSNSVLV